MSRSAGCGVSGVDFASAAPRSARRGRPARDLVNGLLPVITSPSPVAAGDDAQALLTIALVYSLTLCTRTCEMQLIGPGRLRFHKMRNVSGAAGRSAAWPSPSRQAAARRRGAG